MSINSIPVDGILVGSRFPFLNENFIEPHFQAAKVGSFEKVIVHLNISISLVAEVEPVYDDYTRLVVLYPVDGVNVEASNVVVEDLVGDTFGRVDFVSFFLPFFGHQFHDGNVNFTIGDLKNEVLVNCGILTSEEETLFHSV